MAAAIPDNSTEIEDVVASGDRVAVRYTCSGTQTGDLFGVPASGKQLVTGGIEIYRFEGDRVVECWGQYDMSELFARQ
jgi:predicted ester cyclase